MKQYLVKWEIDVFDAENPHHAAQIAHEIMKDPQSSANVFDVRDVHNNTEHEIDLDKPFPNVVALLEAIKEYLNAQPKRAYFGMISPSPNLEKNLRDAIENIEKLIK